MFRSIASKFKQMQVIAMLIALAWPIAASADVAPPPGKVKIGTMIAVKAPSGKVEHTFLLVSTSQRDPSKLTISPFQWGRPFAPASCYRCNTHLVALTSAQAKQLLAVIQKHPAFAKDHKVLQKLQDDAKMQWLSRISFRSLTEDAQTAAAKPLTQQVVDFFKKEKLAKSPALGAKVTADEKYKGSIQVTYYAVEQIKADSIVWKQMNQMYRKDPSKSGPYAGVAKRQRPRISLARNPWFYGGVFLLLFVVFFSTRRNRA